MSIRRLVLILLAVAVTVPAGMFIRHQWRESRICEQEFPSESTDYEICTEYGSNPEGFCADLGRSPFRCSEDYIAGHRQLVAARHAGLYQVRLECTAVNQVGTGKRCSPEQWERYCSQRHSGDRSLPRCLEAGPDGPEGAPPGELQAKVSGSGGPQSGPRTECGTLTTYEARGLQPGAVAVDDDGSVWFTEPAIGALSHMSLDGQVTRRFLGPSPGALVRASGGDLWFTARDDKAIWQVGGSGDPRRHPIPTATSPADLTVGSDGTVWFVETEADEIGRITPDGKVSEVSLARPGEGFGRPSSISAGPDGSVWVSVPLGGRLARVDGRTLAVTRHTVKTGGGTVIAHAVAADAHGNAWFSRPSPSTMGGESFPAGLGRVDSRGAITYHPLPGSGTRWPESMTAGPDGATWFLDAPAKTVGRMGADGTVTEFAAPGLGGSTAGTQLAVGANSLWFSQPDSNSLSRITCG